MIVITNKNIYNKTDLIQVKEFIKELPDDFASAMEFYYVPTVNTRLGTYICAGCK